MRKKATSPKRPNATKNLTAGGQTKKHARIDHEVIDDEFHVKIYRTEDSPNWYVQYTVLAGGQTRKSLKTRNKKEALRKARQIVRDLEIDDIHSPPRQGPKIDEAVEIFISNKGRRKCRGTTITEYRRSLLQFAEFCRARNVTWLGHITPSMMLEYESALAKNGIAIPKSRKTRGRPPKPNKRTTIHEKAKLVKGLTKFAVNFKLMRENPLSGYELPEDGKAKVHCYSVDEVTAICANADPFFGDVFAFLALTGLRQGELRWATKSDLDIQGRRLHVRAKEFPAERLKWDPKGEDRAVPLCPQAFAIAMKMVETTKSRWLFPAPWVPGVVDDRLRPSRLDAQLKKAKKAAGVTKGVLHSFRHYFVSRMANANVSPFKVMKIVGHKSLDIILDYYHVDSQELLAAVDEVDFGGDFRGRTEDEMEN